MPSKRPFKCGIIIWRGSDPQAKWNEHHLLNLVNGVKRYRKLTLGILLGFVGLLVLLGLAALFCPQKILTVDSGPVKADVLVVLGGGIHERPERAAELFKQGIAPRVICSGLGDCNANRQLLIRAGVPAAAILTEGKSRNTHENAEYTIALLRAQHLKSAIIVTSWYHSRRAWRCFQHAAPEIKFYSRPAYLGFARKDWNILGMRHYIKSEYLKLAGYWVRYGVCPV
jgi:uncharacterized SAM-binding protein YcdF (DUF218 family)